MFTVSGWGSSVFFKVSSICSLSCTLKMFRITFWPPINRTPPSVFTVNELILKQKQRSEEKRLKLDHPVSTTHTQLLCFSISGESLSRTTSWLYARLSVFQNGSRWQVFQDVLSPDQDNLDLANVNLMLELLVQKKKQLEAVSKALRLWRQVKYTVLRHFCIKCLLELCSVPW